MTIERMNPKTMRLPVGLSQVVRVEDTVYIAGQAPLESGSIVGIGDIEAQANHVYGSIEAGLQAAGGSLDNLVKISTYITRPDYYPAVVSARERFLGSTPPASSTVIIPAFAVPNILIEMQAIAVVGKTGNSKQMINPPNLPKPEAHAMLVKVGNVIYISGLIAWDAQGNLVGVGDPARQASQIYANMDICLQAVGAKREDVVKTTTFYTHPFYYDALREARGAYYGPNPPTSAAVIVSHLANPNAVLEIEAIAVLGDDKEHLNPDSLSKNNGFSKIVRAGNTAYISGTVGADENGLLVGKGNFETQIRQTYANLEKALMALGGTKQNIVQNTIYYTRPEYGAPLLKEREAAYRGNLPAGMGFGVAGLVNPDMLVEIEAIAAFD